MAQPNTQQDCNNKISFGISQVKNPAPPIVNKIHHALYILIGVYGALVLSTGTQIIPADFQVHYNKIMLMAPSLTLILKQFFGIDMSDCLPPAKNE